MWGVAIDSEKKMRKEAKLLIGDNLKAELVPFSFKHRDGGEIIPRNCDRNGERARADETTSGDS